MIRVLHLLSCNSDMQAQRCSQLLAGELSSEFEISTRRIGRGGDHRNVPAAFAWLSRNSQRFDVLHAWDADVLGAMMGSGHKLVFSPSQTISLATQRLLWLAFGLTKLNVCCANVWHRRSLVARGFSKRLVQVIPPPALAQDGKCAGPDSRSRLGMLDTDLVLLAPGESSRAAGHRDALWTASILHVLDPRWRLLSWGRGAEAELLQRLAKKFRQPRMLCVAERELGRNVEFEEIVSAADFALFTPRSAPAILPLRMCMKAGLPVISSARGGEVGIFNGAQSAAVVADNRPKSLATCLLALAPDEAARRAFSHGAVEAAAHFTSIRFVEEYRQLYRRLSGQ